jgi:hypothetical protein
VRLESQQWLFLEKQQPSLLERKQPLFLESGKPSLPKRKQLLFLVMKQPIFLKRKPPVTKKHKEKHDRNSKIPLIHTLGVYYGKTDKKGIQ